MFRGAESCAPVAPLPARKARHPPGKAFQRLPRRSRRRTGHAGRYGFNEGKKSVGNYLSFALNLSKQTRQPLVEGAGFLENFNAHFNCGVARNLREIKFYLVVRNVSLLSAGVKHVA